MQKSIDDPVRHRRWWLLAPATVIALALAGCGLGYDIIGRHRDTCHREARLVIRDPALWQRFDAGSQAAFEARRARFGPETERATIEAVNGFDQKYGSALTDDRDFTEELTRNDVFITYQGRIVAQYIDFIVAFSSIDGSTNLYCLGLYPELYQTPGRPTATAPAGA